MTDTTWETIRELLVVEYEKFCKRLARRVGSDDLARELLHETYLRLECAEGPAPIRYPAPYLFRIALNIAADWRRSESRKATDREIEETLNLVDETALTEQAVEARLDLTILEEAVEALPPRRRAIFLAVRVHEQSIHATAAAHGISQRLVELELKRALIHCATQLNRPVIQRFGPKAPKASYLMRDDGNAGDGSL